MANHLPRIVVENEYDEYGNIIGQSGREICSKCGEILGFMDTDEECKVR